VGTVDDAVAFEGGDPLLPQESAKPSMTITAAMARPRSQIERDLGNALPLRRRRSSGVEESDIFDILLVTVFNHDAYLTTGYIARCAAGVTTTGAVTCDRDELAAKGFG